MTIVTSSFQKGPLSKRFPSTLNLKLFTFPRRNVDGTYVIPLTNDTLLIRPEFWAEFVQGNSHVTGVKAAIRD